MGFDVKRQEDFGPKDWLAYYPLNQAILQESYPYRDIVSEAQFLRDPRLPFALSWQPMRKRFSPCCISIWLWALR
jgi:hypothetical protein